MHHRRPHRLFCIPLLLVAVLCACAAAASAQAQAAAPAPGEARPNFVLVFADDQGYGDLGVFGATDFETPRIDRMAYEGMGDHDRIGSGVRFFEEGPRWPRRQPWITP